MSEPNLSERQTDALMHIADYCRTAGTVVRDFSAAEELEADRRSYLALVRCIEVVGEAANRLGPEYHRNHPEVPWRKIIGMRNWLIHGYDQVNPALVWQTATREVPALLAAVEGWLAPPEPTPFVPSHLRADPPAEPEEPAQGMRR